MWPVYSFRAERTMKSMIVAIVLFGCASLFGASYEIVEKADNIVVQTDSFAGEHHMENIRILTQEGRNYTKILPLNSYVRISNVQGFVQYPDGHMVRLEPKDVFEVPILVSAEILTDRRALMVIPPELEKGCLVRIEYDRAVTSLLYLDPWIYAMNVPITKASCTLTYPNRIPIKYRSEDPEVRVQQSSTTEKTTVQFEVQAQKEMILQGVLWDGSEFEKSVEFVAEKCTTDSHQLNTSTWRNVADWFSELTRLSYHEDPSMDALVNEITSKYGQPEKVAAALYAHVQKNFEYTALDVGNGFKPQPASKTFQRRYGLSFLYITLLRKAGIEAYPALVDTRSSRIFSRDFPNPLHPTTQFLRTGG